MSTTGDQSDGDYSYDQVHDDMSTSAEASAGTPTEDTPQREESQPPEADGDYSYDLAHEVPRSSPESPSL